MLVLRVTASRSVGGGESLNSGGELRRVPVCRVADVERTMRRNNEQVRRAGSKSRFEEQVRRALGFLRSWPPGPVATDIMLRFA